MKPEWAETRRILEANLHRPVKLVLSDETFVANVYNTDDEGFGYDMEENGVIGLFWTRYTDFVSLEALDVESR